MTERRRRSGGAASRAAAAAIIVMIAIGAVPLCGAQLLDRVIAVVSGTVITLSDARAAMALGLVDTRDARDPIEAAMQWLVDRRLVLDEALRSDTSDIGAAVVDRAMGAVRQRFASESAYREELVRLGLDETRVRGLVSDTLTMQQYLERRFDSLLPPTEDELREFFGRQPERFVADNRPLAFEQAIDQVRVTLQQERRAEALKLWLDRLRRRADINEIYQAVR